MTSIAASRPSAIGRSKWLPSFNTSAGARLTVMRRGGNARPRAPSAARTRSRDTADALSGKPTTLEAGSPPPAFAARLFRQAEDVESRQAAADRHLRLDIEHLDAMKRHRLYPRDHCR